LSITQKSKDLQAIPINN